MINFAQLNTLILKNIKTQKRFENNDALLSKFVLIS